MRTPTALASDSSTMAPMEVSRDILNTMWIEFPDPATFQSKIVRKQLERGDVVVDGRRIEGSTHYHPFAFNRQFSLAREASESIEFRFRTATSNVGLIGVCDDLTTLKENGVHLQAIQRNENCSAIDLQTRKVYSRGNQTEPRVNGPASLNSNQAVVWCKVVGDGRFGIRFSEEEEYEYCLKDIRVDRFAIVVGTCSKRMTVELEQVVFNQKTIVDALADSPQDEVLIKHSIMNIVNHINTRSVDYWTSANAICELVSKCFARMGPSYDDVKVNTGDALLTLLTTMTQHTPPYTDNLAKSCAYIVETFPSLLPTMQIQTGVKLCECIVQVCTLYADANQEYNGHGSELMAKVMKGQPISVISRIFNGLCALPSSLVQKHLYADFAAVMMTSTALFMNALTLNQEHTHLLSVHLKRCLKQELEKAKSAIVADDFTVLDVTDGIKRFFGLTLDAAIDNPDLLIKPTAKEVKPKAKEVKLTLAQRKLLAKKNTTPTPTTPTPTPVENNTRLFSPMFCTLMKQAADVFADEFNMHVERVTGNNQLLDRYESQANIFLQENRAIYNSVLAKLQTKPGMDQLFDLSRKKAVEVNQKFKKRPHQPGKPQTILDFLELAMLNHASYTRLTSQIFEAAKTTAAAKEHTKETEPTMTYPHPPIKKAYRLEQKECVRGGCDGVCDGNRNMIIVTTATQFVAMINGYFQCGDVEVVGFKDRLNEPTSGGWADVQILFRTKTTGVIGETQIALQMMVDARKGMEGHAAFGMARYYIELMGKCGRPFQVQKNASGPPSRRVSTEAPLVVAPLKTAPTVSKIEEEVPRNNNNTNDNNDASNNNNSNNSSEAINLARENVRLKTQTLELSEDNEQLMTEAETLRQEMQQLKATVLLMRHQHTTEIHELKTEIANLKGLPPPEPQQAGGLAPHRPRMTADQQPRMEQMQATAQRLRDDKLKLAQPSGNVSSSEKNDW